MKVLLVYPRMAVYGGAELLIVRLCNFLSAQGIANTLLSTSVLPEVRENLENTPILEAYDVGRRGGSPSGTRCARTLGSRSTADAQGRNQ